MRIQKIWVETCVRQLDGSNTKLIWYFTFTSKKLIITFWTITWNGRFKIEIYFWIWYVKFTPKKPSCGAYLSKCTSHLNNPPQIGGGGGGIPEANLGFHLVFTRFRFPASWGMHLFFHRVAFSLRGLIGSLAEISLVVNELCLMFRGRGSSLWIFLRKARLSMDFTNSKREFPGFPPIRPGLGEGVWAEASMTGA